MSQHPITGSSIVAGKKVDRHSGDIFDSQTPPQFSESQRPFSSRATDWSLAAGLGFSTNLVASNSFDIQHCDYGLSHQ
jgi:hypothetical protein